MRVFRHHGVEKKPGKGAWYYEIEKPGYNYRITDLQCALGLSQMRKFGKFITGRREIVKEYNRAFKRFPELILPAEESFAKPVYHLYVVELELSLLKAGRKQIFDELRKEGIGVQVHYMPLHMHPFYKKKFAYKKGDFPVAETYYERALTLPLFPQMTKKDVKTVILKVSKVIAKYR